MMADSSQRTPPLTAVPVSTNAGFMSKEPGDGSVFLLKVPRRLGEAWKSAEVGAVLAEVDAPTGRGERNDDANDNDEAPSMMQLHVVAGRGAQSTTTYEVVPNEVAELELRAFRARAARTQDDEGKEGSRARRRGVVVGGQPAASFGLKPKVGIGYRRDLRSRMVDSLRSTRVVRAIDESDVPDRAAGSGIKRFRTDDDDDAGGATAKRKLTALSKPELKSRLFRILANARDPPTLKDIQADLGDAQQPEGYLREVLDEMCVKERLSGRVFFVLKPEYRGRASGGGVA